MPERGDFQRFRSNLQGEVDGEAVYAALADAERDPKLSEVYRRLAVVEASHAEFWRKRLDQGDLRRLKLKPSGRARALAWLARRFGASFILPTIASADARDSAAYDAQADARAGGLPADERSHARIIAAAASQVGGVGGSTLATLEGRHRGGAGNALRTAVLGANDGLVSNLSLVMGVAGAAASGRTILLTGLAGLVAGACSMAMGEWLSVTSARELAEKQIETEAAELEQSPELEKEELILIYQAKGLEESHARALAEQLLSHKETALDTLVREELGIDPSTLGGSPWSAAGASFGLFAVGAVAPVAPFLFLDGGPAVPTSLAVSGVVLIAIGAGVSLLTGKSTLVSAVRQLLIGYAAAGATFAIGKLVGVSLS